MHVHKSGKGMVLAWRAMMAGVMKLLMLVTCVGILSLLADWAAAGLLIGPGQDSFNREVGLINGDGYTLNYELFLPPGHEVEGALPLIVYLHGYGDGRDIKQERLNDTIEDLVYTTQHNNSQRGVASELAPQMDQQYEGYLLVPKIPEEEGWYNRLGLAKQLMDQVASNYEIDSQRIYLAGFSNGAFAIPSMIEQNPGTFAAGVSFSGGGSLSTSSAMALKDTPLWFFHDKTDPTVDYLNSVSIVEALNSVGGSPKLTLSNERRYGHDSWRPALRDMNNTLYPWLFSQAVPEPSTCVLLLSVVGCFLIRRGKIVRG